MWRAGLLFCSWHAKHNTRCYKTYTKNEKVSNRPTGVRICLDLQNARNHILIFFKIRLANLECRVNVSLKGFCWYYWIQEQFFYIMVWMSATPTTSYNIRVQPVPAWHPWVFLHNEKYASSWGRIYYSSFYTCSIRWAPIPALLILLLAAQLCCWAVDSTRMSSRQSLQSSPLPPLSGFADLSPITPATKREWVGN